MAKQKEKHLVVSEETHLQAKSQAAQAGLTIDKYIKLCLVQCEKSQKTS